MSYDPHQNVFFFYRGPKSRKKHEGFDISKLVLKHDGDVYVRNPEHDFKYHIFHANLSPSQREEINTGLDANKKEYIWMNITSARNVLDLVLGLDEYIRLFYF